MAVLVGLVVGFIGGVRRRRIALAILLILPLAMALLEIVVNTVRFGASSMPWI